MTFFDEYWKYYLFDLTYLSSYKTSSVFIFLCVRYSASMRTELFLPYCWRRILAWAYMIPWCSRFQVFLNHLSNIVIVQVLGCSGGVRSRTVRFSPRPLNFNTFVGKMRLPASLISFNASFRSGWKGIMIMNSYLSGSLVLRGFKPCPSDPPYPVDFWVGL